MTPPDNPTTLEAILCIAALLFGSGGIVAWRQARTKAKRSEARAAERLAETAVESVQVLLDPYRETIEDLQGRFRAVRLEVKEQGERINALEIKLAAEQREKAALIERIAHLEEELAATRAERDALKIEREAARDQIAALERKIEQLIGEIERLRAQLEAPMGL